MSQLAKKTNVQYPLNNQSLAKRFKKHYKGWIFILLATAGIGLFYFYPMVQAFLLSLKSGMGTNLEFVGLDNYIRLFKDPTFLSALTNTFIYLLVQVPVMIILALFFSVLLNDPTLKFKGFFRTAIFLPCVTSLVAYSVIFKYLFGVDGLINKFLLNYSLKSSTSKGLPDTATPSNSSVF